MSRVSRKRRGILFLGREHQVGGGVKIAVGGSFLA